METIRDQVNHKKSVDYIAISNDRKKQQKDDLLWKKENDNIKTLLGQLGWITGQTDLAFDVCQLSSILNRSKVDDVLKGNKLHKDNNKDLTRKVNILRGALGSSSIIWDWD